MAKRKKSSTQIISTPDVPMYGRHTRAVDLSNEEWARRASESRKPTITYWTTIIPLALISVAVGFLQISTQGITFRGIGFLIAGIILIILIVTKLIRR